MSISLKTVAAALLLGGGASLELKKDPNGY